MTGTGGATDRTARRSARHWVLTALIPICTVVGGCASEMHGEGAGQPPSAATQVQPSGPEVPADTELPVVRAPAGVSALYSQANLEFMLATMPAAADCEGPDCAQHAATLHAAFDRRVAEAGARVAAAAYESYPGLAERVPQFNFSVVDKAEAGTGSTAGGRVVVLRPVGDLAQSDAALSFVLAREVGHVVARHHEENTATSLIISAVTTVVAPALSLARLVAAAYSTATTAAASFFGSRALIDTYRPRQREQADGIALNLLGHLGYDSAGVASGFSEEGMKASQSRWIRDLQASLTALAGKSTAEVKPAAPAPEPSTAGPTHLAAVGTATPAALAPAL